MKPTTTLFFVFLTSVFSSFATELNKEKGIIAGKVFDESTEKPIEFAAITLMDQDSVILNGTLSDSTGSFKFAGLFDGDYIVKSDFIGYESVFSNVSLVASKREVDLGKINLRSFSGLDALVVEGGTSAYSVEIDKKVYDPSQNPVNEGGTGLDVLRNMPSIDVDADDNISLRGDQNVNILIDGRPIAMSASQFLKQIPAGSIERVEVITNPSAKYDPEGTSGILNIILKKNRTKGLNGTASAGFGRGQYNKMNGGLSLNYMSEKFNVSSALNLWNGEFGFGGSMLREIYSDTTLGLSSEDDGRRDNLNQYGSVNVDYFLNDKNTVYLGGSGSIGDNVGNRDIGYNFLQNQQITGSSIRTGNIDGDNNNYTINGGWQKKFSKQDHTFDLDARYAISESASLEELNEAFYDANGAVHGNAARQSVTNRNNNNIINLRADYVNPLSDSLKLEAGVHFTGKYIGTTIYSESFDWNSDAFEPDVAINNEFDYSQNVLASYVTIGQQFKRIGLKFGLRAEQTNTLSELITTNETFRNDYFELFPSAHTTYSKTPFSVWQLSYSRRINRPETHEINPFTTYDDPYTLQRGNPFLLPEFIHVFEAGHNLIKSKFSLNTTLYYRRINDQKRRYLQLLDNGISEVSYDNLSMGNLKGAEVILGINPSKLIRSTITFNYWHNNVSDAVISDGNSTSNHGWSVDYSIMGNFKGGLTAQVSGNYRGKMQVVQGIITPAYGIDLAVRKRIMNNRGTIGLRAQDIFKTRNFNFLGENLDGYYFESKRIWESRQVWVSFSYFFGKQVKGKQRKRLSDNSSGDNRDIPDMQ